jgi:glycosyltransferase involved in cell wall biosynthesis
MDWPAHCAAVIPCLNEAATIEHLTREVRHTLPTVIVVDDGSTDATASLAAKAGASVIRHEYPLGKGAALTDGVERAHQLGFTWVLMMDGDGQHAPSEISSFLDCADQTGALLVIGNRMGNAEQMPRLRRFVNRWMSLRISRLAGCFLPDTQCGFRLVKLDAWRQLAPKARYFEIESEGLLGFLAAGHKVEFVPIQAIYKAEQSKIHPVRDTWRWFRWLWSRRGP